MEQVKAPRAAFLNFPLGRNCGKPNDPELQRRILRDALKLLEEISTPGEIVDLPYEWGEPFTWEDFMRDLGQMLEEEGSPIQEWKPKDKG